LKCSKAISPSKGATGAGCSLCSREWDAWSVLGSVDKQAGDTAKAKKRCACDRAVAGTAKPAHYPGFDSGRAGRERECRGRAQNSRSVEPRGGRKATASSAWIAAEPCWPAAGKRSVIQLQTAVTAEPELLEAHVALATHSAALDATLKHWASARRPRRW